MSKTINLAIISPQKSAYSETFINAQKELLPFNIYYYYDGIKPMQLEGKGKLISSKRSDIYSYRVKNKLGLTNVVYKDYQIIKSFKENEIDIVLAQYGITGQAMVPICKYLGLPLLVYFYGFDASIKKVIENNNNYKELFSYADKVLCVSNSLAVQLRKIGCNEEKIVVNVASPNDTFIKIKPKINRPLFIGVGRFTDKKAPYYTILAFEKVYKEYPEARLKIFGDGPLYNTCVNLVKFLRLEQVIELPGAVKPEQYLKYYEYCIAFVQHSITADNGDSEGTPVAILEASAAGLPVISTMHAGIPEVIIEGKTGLLVEEHDVEGMANAMRELLEDKALAIELGNAGKERVRRKYNMGIHINKLASIIKESSDANK
jgi:glycosyltransferase involved in cell wall biosynthesis